MPGVLPATLERLDLPRERLHVGHLAERCALRLEPRLPRSRLVASDALVGKRRFDGVRLAPVNLPPLPESIVFRPKRGERAFRTLERSFRFGRARARALQAGPLTAEPCLQLLQPGRVGGGLAARSGQRLLRAGERLAQISALAPELGDGLLRPTHLGPHLQGGPISHVVLVRGPSVRGARSFQLRLRRALSRARRLEPHFLPADGRAPCLRLAFQSLPAQREQLRAQPALFLSERGVPLRLSRLTLEAGKLLVELLANVGQPCEVVVRLPHPALGLAATLPVERDAGRFLEEPAQLLGLRFDEARHRALLDDRVAARAETGAEEEVGDVAPPAACPVHVVGRLALAG